MNSEDYNMPLPKKIKKYLPLTQSKTLLPRRQELLDKINKDGTFLPKSILHADLDGGFLDFVKNELKLVVEGKVVPVVDILVTTQNWIQFTQTWDFQNIDKNLEPPFISIVRIPEVKFGTNPAVLYNIPNRRQFFYAQVPTWDGNRQGMDIYKIPQPIPVDITFQVKIVCNRMRELNQFNKVILDKFASIQAYQVIKGHYIPIKNTGISDESVMDIEKRKYYIQSYDFLMMGFLIDENEFQVSPAINRVLQVVEFEPNTTKRQKRVISDNKSTNQKISYDVGVTTLSQVFYYTTDLTIGESVNVSSFDVYINSDFYGTDVNLIQVNTNDVVRIDIVKTDVNLSASLELFGLLL
jgi:hypothetical protein